MTTIERLTALEKKFASLEAKMSTVKTAKKASTKKASSDSDGETKVKRPPTKFALYMKEVLPFYKEAMGDKKGKGGFHLKIGGYLNTKGVSEPTLKDVVDAIAYLEENPDYKSATAQKKSEGSVKSAKKEADEEVEEATEKPKKAEKLSSKKSVAEDVEVENWSHNDTEYFKTLKDEVLTEEFEWVGLWTGKKIDKTAKMPTALRKWIEANK